MNYNFVREKLYYKIIDNISLHYKGYQIKNVVSSDFAMPLLTRKNLDIQLNLKSAYYKSLNIIDCNNSLQNSSELTFIHQDDRLDYMQLIESIQNQLSLNCTVTHVPFFPNKSLPRNFKTVLNFVFALTYSIIRFPFGSFNLKINIAYRIARAFNTIDNLEKIKIFKISAFILFNSSAFFQPYLSFFAKKRKIKTFSLQHAIYFKYKKYKPLDIINYENFTADYLLCWGPQNVELFSEYGISKDKLLVCGNPKYKNKKIQSVRQKFNRGLLLLPRFLYDEENLQLLKVIHHVKNLLKIDFFVKLHPSLNIESYLAVCNAYGLEIIPPGIQMNQVFDDYDIDFGIAYNSTSYYECLIHGRLCFRYLPGENDILEGIEEDQFTNIDTLISNFSYFEKTDKKILLNKINDIIEYMFGNQNNDYRCLLDYLPSEISK